MPGVPPLYIFACQRMAGPSSLHMLCGNAGLGIALRTDSIRVSGSLGRLSGSKRRRPARRCSQRARSSHRRELRGAELLPDTDLFKFAGVGEPMAAYGTPCPTQVSPALLSLLVPSGQVVLPYRASWVRASLVTVFQ